MIFIPIRHCTMTSLGLVAVLAGSSFGEWTNSLKPSGSPAKEIVLVKDGKAARSIQIPANATAVEKKAAEELQQWIQQITTARLEITNTPKGRTVRLRTDPSFGTDGYGIAVDGDDLVLSGGTGRGVVNAVYALLEEDFGCRFYTNKSIRLPRGNSLSVQPVARTFVPKILLRDPFYKCAFDPDWSVRNRTNSPSAVVGDEYGGHLDYGGMFVHTHAVLLPHEQYFQEHPEYFALSSDGKRYAAQICPTHPEVIKIVTAAVLDKLKKDPSADIVSVSKNDSGGDQLCYCDRCRKIRTQEAAEIGCQLVLVNAVAEAVEKEFPNVTIDTLAYLDTLQPPKHIRPRANVVIRLCNDTVSEFTPASKIPFGKTMAKWTTVHNRFSIWDYNTNFHHYLAPVPNVDVMADNIRFYVNNHVEGVMLQGCYQGPGDGDEMKSWVASKILWDPTRDYKPLVQDFIWGHYGAAAPAMVEYEELRNGLRKTFAKEMAAPPGAVNFPMDAPFLNKEFIDKATAILERAKQLAAGDEEIIRRIERAQLSILYVKCKRGPAFSDSDYGKDIAEFERIARREDLRVLTEGQPNMDSVLAGWKKKIPKPAAKKS